MAKSGESGKTSSGTKKKEEAMKFTEVRKLVRLLESSDIHELELERDGARLRIRKAEPTASPTYVTASPGPAAAPTAPAAAPAGEAATVGAASAEPAAAPAETARTDYHEIKSPMVGTFYRSPAPDADPYVQVGDRVKAGQTLCIIEAMKLMNEIEADISGVVKEVLVENGQPVEFGQVMFHIDPQG
jgi:acetyl-CoA carboxylase biotin carboxyl carrier protein